MPALLIPPIFGIAAIALIVAHAAHRAPARAERAPQDHPGSRQVELDRGMPEALVHQVLTALVEETVPAHLDALATELAGKYPIAAGELRARGAELRAASAPPAPLAEKPAPAAPTAPRAAAPRAPGVSSPDLSEAALVLQAAMKAYAEETDPVALEGFANSIREKFPTGAILLFGRARELQAARGASAGGPTVPAAPGAAIPLPLPPGKPATPAIYVVKPGDTLALIAERLVHDGKRWPELTAANPTKPVAHDGNFATLRPGETLSLPTSWPTPSPEHTGAPRAGGQS